MDERRKQLGQHIKRTRRAAPFKFKSQKAFADAIGVHETSVANAETGSDRVGEAVFTAIEDGLRWPADSISSYLGGLTEALPGKGDRPPPSATEPPHEWSAENRARILAMSGIDIIEQGRTFLATSGEHAAMLWLKEAARIKAEAQGIPTGEDVR